MFQSSHYSWSVAKNFVPLFPFVFLFFCCLVTCVRLSTPPPPNINFLGVERSSVLAVVCAGQWRRREEEAGSILALLLGSPVFDAWSCLRVCAAFPSEIRTEKPQGRECFALREAAVLLLSPVSVLLHSPSSHFIMDHYHQSGGSSRGGVPPKFYQRSQSVVDRNGSADLTPPPLQQQQHEWPGPPVPVRSERRGAFRRRVSLFNKDTALPDVKIETTPLFPPQYHLYLLWAPRDLLYTPFLKGVGYLTTTRSTTRQKGVYFSSPS